MEEANLSPILHRNMRRSLGRKSLSTPGRLAVSHSPSFTDVPVNDDEAERRRRHRERVLEMQRKNLSSPATPTDRRQSLGTGIAGLTNAQLAEHYANCMKLSAENKITIKNAFGLHLIDYMADMLKNRDGSTNFQMASCTLDASAKIYAYRVDCVHAEAFKMAGGLGIAEDQKNSCEKRDEDSDEQKNTKKKKRVKKSNTVEQNVKVLNFNKFEIGFQIDPMFIKLSAAYEEGGVNGILFNTLCSDDRCVIPLHDLSTIPDLSSEKEQSMVDITFLKELNSRIQDEEVTICPEYENFSFLNWDASLDASAHEDLSPSKRSVLAFDMDAEPEPLEDSMNDDNDVLDDDGVADDNCNNFSEPDGQDTVFDSLFSERRDACQSVKTPGVRAVRLESVSDLSKVLSSRPSEYSYFDNSLLSTWAGPNHWKVRPFSKSSIPDQIMARKKVKKTQLKLNYDEVKDFSSFFIHGKRTIILNKKTMQLWSKEKITLPHDIHYDPQKLVQLFTASYLHPHLMNTTSEVDPGVGDYNYNNPNDKENFCPGTDSEDTCTPDDDTPVNQDDGTLSVIEASDGGISQFNITGIPAVETNFTGDNLVQAPIKIAKLDIHYARTAKKIDVKRLKQVMWRILSKSNEENKENIEEQQLPLKMEGQVKFSELYKTLPEKVSLNMKKNLSIPIAFVCFLHIVNEKNLSLIQQQDLSDFLIEQA